MQRHVEAGAHAERLALRGVAKSYGPAIVLQPTTLAVRDGEFLTILGPSGSGKTTILRLIAGFVRPDAGTIVFDGADITATPPHRRPFNTVFQDYALFPHMTVAGNVGYGPMVRGLPRGQIRARVDETLAVVGLAALRDRRPGQLSGGQRQRVALARAIVNEPAMILLDEPLAALDAGLRKQMQLFLKDLQQRIRTAFVFVTHDQEEAITMSDRVVVMDHGRIVQIGSPLDVYRMPDSLFVARFFGDNNLLPAIAEGGVFRTACGVLPAPREARGAVTLAIRPESILLRGDGDSDADQQGSIDATVKRVIFTGAVLRVEVLAGETDLIVKLAGVELARVPPPGSPVRLLVPPAAIHVIAET